MRRQNQRFTRALPSELAYETSKSTFYTCFTNRINHMKRQNQRFTRVLPSELGYETSKSTFSTRFTIISQHLNWALVVPPMAPYTPGAINTSQTRSEMQSRALFLTLLDFGFRNVSPKQCLGAALNFWFGDVKINVLHVFYHQNWPYKTSKSTFYACFTIRTWMWDVKINVLHVFYHQN